MLEHAAAKGYAIKTLDDVLNLRCAQINRIPRGPGFPWDRRRLANETVMLLARCPEIHAQRITHRVPYDDAPAFVARLVGEGPEFVRIVSKVSD